MKEKTLSLVLAFVLLALTLAACGGGDSGIPEGRFVREGGGGYGGITDGYISIEFKDGEVTLVSFDTNFERYHTRTYTYTFKNGMITLEELGSTDQLTVIDNDTIRWGHRYVREN
jgi:hypothetical protein